MSEFWRQLMMRFRADKRRYLSACGLLLVGLLLWGRLVIVERVPRTGFADPESASVGPDADGLSADAAPPPVAAGSEGEGAIAVPRDPYPLVAIPVPDRLARNLFASSSAGLAPSSQSNADRPSSPKSRMDSSDKPDVEALERSRRMENVREAAKSLRLDSVMLGPKRSIAIVSGVTVTVGDEVNGFKVEAIVERSVTLSRDGIILTLQMETPGQP